MVRAIPPFFLLLFWLATMIVLLAINDDYDDGNDDMEYTPTQKLSGVKWSATAAVHFIVRPKIIQQTLVCRKPE